MLLPRWARFDVFFPCSQCWDWHGGIWEWYANGELVVAAADRHWGACGGGVEFIRVEASGSVDVLLVSLVCYVFGGVPNRAAFKRGCVVRAVVECVPLAV